MARTDFKGLIMKLFIRLFPLLIIFTLSSPALANINVFACEPEWASLANELGGERISSYSATTAFQDPHHIQARPSLIAKIRRADLVVCSGAELEAGWLPMLQRQAGNSNIMPGKPGYFEAAAMVQRLDLPAELDRSMGDVHASGNPHVHLDPRRIQTIAKALLARLITIDPAGKRYYQQRFNRFNIRWTKAINRWQQQASILKGTRIVVHHRDWVYLFDWLGIKIAAALEPKPGLPATAGHLVSLKRTLQENPAKMIVHTTYQNPRAAQRLSQITNTSVVELPYTVGGSAQVNDLYDLFTVTIEKLKGAL